MKWPQLNCTPREAAVLLLLFLVVGTMLLIGLNQSRSHSRRAACEANLIQVSRGILSFVDQTGSYPHVNSSPLAPGEQSPLGRVAPGAVSATPRDESTSTGWQVDGYSWIVRLLPYLEQQALYDEIARASSQFELPAFALKLPPGTPQQHPASRQLAFLRCPSFPHSRRTTPGQRYGLNNVTSLGRTNYLALASATSGARQDGIVDDLDPILGGVIASANMTARREPTGVLIPDGASQTLMLVESRQETFSAWYSGQSAWTVGFPPAESAKLRGTSVLDAGFVGPPASTPSTGLNYGRDMSTEQGAWFAEDWAGGPRDWGPSSYHPQTVTHSFADGNVVQLDPSIDALVYAQLIATGDGHAAAATKNSAPPAPPTTPATD